jgi:hypothetical protein
MIQSRASETSRVLRSPRRDDSGGEGRRTPTKILPSSSSLRPAPSLDLPPPTPRLPAANLSVTDDHDPLRQVLKSVDFYRSPPPPPRSIQSSILFSVVEPGRSIGVGHGRGQLRAAIEPGRRSVAAGPCLRR